MGEFHQETKEAVENIKDEFKTFKIVIPGKIRQKDGERQEVVVSTKVHLMRCAFIKGLL